MTALQCFEAAARHLSFTRAAEELHLTQSAVSKQVAQLEEMLCHPLFQRVRQRLYLSPAGSLYLEEVRKILNQVDISSRYILTYGGETEVLRIATQPTFGDRWLVPKLGDFIARHGDIQLNLVTKVTIFDFNGSGIDAAIHFGRDVWPEAVCHRLLGEVIVPVCSPSLLGGRPKLDQPQDVKLFPLLHLVTRPQAWADWMHAVGVKSVEELHGPRFEEFHMVIQACIAGLGLAVLPRFLIQEEISSGRLVTAIDRPVTSDQAYYLVHPEGKGDLFKVCVFRDWLIEQCRKETFS